MKRIVIQKGTYADSLYTMLLSRELKQKSGVLFSSVVMGTSLHVSALIKHGFPAEDFEQVRPDDLVIAFEYEDETLLPAILSEIKGFLLGVKSAGEGTDQVPASLEEALALDSNANLAIISVPGRFAAYEAQKALEHGLHVLLFSGQVPVEDELFLKRMGTEKGLLVMGPDCGGAIIRGTGLCFANAVGRGPIGIVFASGAGMQEVSCLIDRMESGISHAIGTGARDLQDLRIAGRETLLAIEALAADPETKVLVLVAPPPKPELAVSVLSALQRSGKPSVVHFLGTEIDLPWIDPKIQFASNLQETAALAVSLVQPDRHGRTLHSAWPFELDPDSIDELVRHEIAQMDSRQQYVRAYFTGGTFCKEAVSVLADLPEGLWSNIPCKPARMLYNPYHSVGHTVLDLSDGFFSVGKEHPVIDPSSRIERVEADMDDPSVQVMVFDCILGCGACDNPAEPLALAISKAKRKARERGGYLSAIVSVTGTDRDRQDRKHQIALLERAQAIVMPTNYQAVRLAKRILLRVLGSETQHVQTYSHRLTSQPVSSGDSDLLLDRIGNLFEEGPMTVDVGWDRFSKDNPTCDNENHHVFWIPPARGNPQIFDSLSTIARTNNGRIESANRKAMCRILASVPLLRGIERAGAVIPGMRKNLVLHAGPPVKWEQMCEVMKASIVGGLLYEGLADTREEAEFLAGSGEIDLRSSQTYGVAGPFAGVVTQSMPVWVVQNETYGNLAYATVNEGPGKALTYGSSDFEVLERLSWIEHTFTPMMQKVLEKHGPMDLQELMAKALLMGDECHAQNQAASTLFLSELGPNLVMLPNEKQTISDVLAFVEGNDHFFLNLAIAACKCVMDCARGIPCSSIVTAMSQNGVEFGIQVSAFKNRWFLSSAPKADGVYSRGFSAADATACIGDSSMLETLGLGAFSLASSPAVAKCIGGAAADAVALSRRMYRIACGESETFRLPVFDFKGSPTGIDIRRVVEREVVPIIDAKIVHKVPGRGVIGAGLVEAPMECFAKAVTAFADLCCSG